MYISIYIGYMYISFEYHWTSKLFNPGIQVNKSFTMLVFIQNKKKLYDEKLSRLIGLGSYRFIC